MGHTRFWVLRLGVFCFAAVWAPRGSWGSTPENRDAQGEDDAWYNDDFGDEDAIGFDTPESGDQAAIEAPNPLSLDGAFRSQWGAWVERFSGNPFAKGRQNLDLQLRYTRDWFRLLISGHAEYDLAYLHQRSRYDSETLDEYEWLVDLRESVIHATLSWVQLSFGRQTVVWGEGDVLSPLDIANARDLREPGLSDLEDIRLPVLSTKVGVTADAYRIEAMMIHESFFGLRSPPLGPFSPWAEVVGRLDQVFEGLEQGLRSRPLAFVDRPGRYSLKNQQGLLRVTRWGRGLDLGFYVASVLDRDGVFVPPTIEALFAPGPLEFVIAHPRYTLVGTSGALPLGDWLIKWELAASVNRALNVLAPAPDNRTHGRATLLDGMLSWTYSGFSNTFIFLEFQQRFLLTELPKTLFSTKMPAVALRSRHTFLREDLELHLALSGIGWNFEGGWLARLELRFRAIDHLWASIGLTSYHPGRELSPLSGLNQHDRFFARFRYDFSLY